MKPIRVIVLPNDKRVSLGVYANAWRKLLSALPDARIEGWSHFTTSASDILAEMRKGLADRINKHDPHFGNGRKWDSEWHWQAWRLSRSLASRVRIYPCDVPRELRARLAHRIATD